MQQNTQTVRELVNNIILYGALIPARMLSELRQVVLYLDKQTQNGSSARHETAHKQGAVAITVDGLCEIVVENDATDSDARITIDDGEITTSSALSWQSYADVCDLLARADTIEKE